MSAAEFPQALVAALHRLDERLSDAVDAAEAAFGAPRTTDALRGLYVERTDVDATLARGPLTPAFELAEPHPLATATDEPFASLHRAFALDQLELDVLLLAYAPELDVRYERVYGFLQDDITRRRPTVDLALALFASGPERRIVARAQLLRGRLAAEGVIELVGDGPLSSRELRLDEAIAAWLETCETGAVEADPGMLGPEETVARAVVAARSLAQPLRIHLAGPSGCGQRAVAHAVAYALNRRVLECEAAETAAADRLARIADAVLFVDGDELPAVELRAPVVVSTAPTPGAVELAVRRPRLAARRAAWSAAVGADGVAEVAARFRLTFDDIDAAAQDAVRQAAARGRPVGRDELFAAARARSGDGLVGLATRVAPVRTWDDLVLAEEQLVQLHELCDTVVGRAHVLDDYGFGDRLSNGHGVTALFAGAPGTGKTLAAEVVANELGLDLFRIDLAGVVSKYIGETEKNLDRIFAAAEGATAVLLFDEADALFGKRSEVHDSHDRFANIEISYLLQKMELYDGVAILATNLKESLDDAFIRRLTYLVWFSRPKVAQRRRMWEQAWPAATPRADDVDPERLAAEHPLTGAAIRNIAVAAASLAAAAGEPVTAGHIERATIREYAKSGKRLQPAELGS